MRQTFTGHGFRSLPPVIHVSAAADLRTCAGGYGTLLAGRSRFGLLCFILISWLIAEIRWNYGLEYVQMHILMWLIWIFWQNGCFSISLYILDGKESKFSRLGYWIGMKMTQKLEVSWSTYCGFSLKKNYCLECIKGHLTIHLANIKKCMRFGISLNQLIGHPSFAWNWISRSSW